jgi:hypothetical protein
MLIKLSSLLRMQAPSRPLSPELHADSLPSPEAAVFQYDSDFSEPSTPGEPDSEADRTTNVVKIPDFYMETPRIPNGCMTWTCPKPGCDHRLDLIDISRMVKDLPQFFPGSQVPMGNDWDVRTALLMLISWHYESHLEEANLKVFRSSSTTWHVEPLQAPEAVVKQEIDSNLELQMRRSGRKPRPRKKFESSV